MSQSNPASDLLDHLWQKKQMAETVRPAGTDAEAQAEITRDAANASAFRGLLFGVPLAIAMWGIPTAAWLASGSTLIGIATGIAEFVILGWLVWVRRERVSPPAGDR